MRIIDSHHAFRALTTRSAMTTTSTAPAVDAPHLANPDLYPSFTKGVFLGELREDLVFPFPVLPPEEKESLAMNG